MKATQLSWLAFSALILATLGDLQAQTRFTLDPAWPQKQEKPNRTFAYPVAAQFRYEIRSYTPEIVPSGGFGGMSGMGMAGGMGGYGGEGGYAGGGYGADYGGGGYDGGGYGGGDMMASAPAKSNKKLTISVIRTGTDPDGQAQLELLVPRPKQANSGNRPIATGMGMGMGMESPGPGMGGAGAGGYGSDSGDVQSGYGGGGESGYGGGADGGYGEMSGEGMMGSGSGERKIYISLKQLDASQIGETYADLAMPSQEIEVISDFMKQYVWHKEMVEQIRRNGSDSQFVLKMEPKLKALLSDQYTNQLARQRLEIAVIESKVKSLRDELARRESAMERVVEIQSGRILLEAQGLLK